MLSRVYLIAAITYRQSARQSLFYIIVLASVVLLFIAAPFALFGFGEEVTMFREIGLATITFACLIIAILSADTNITAEIEKQTILTIFTKPLHRAEFIFGKFLGIAYTLFLTVICLGIVFLMVYWLKEGRSQIDTKLMEGEYLKRGATAILEDTLKFFQKDGLILAAGIYVSFLQGLIISAVAVAFATFFTLPITAMACFVFFLLGHIAHYILNALLKSGFAPLVVLYVILYPFLPNLTHLNVSTPVASLSPISVGYLGLVTLYAVIYSTIILLVTSIIFGRREF